MKQEPTPYRGKWRIRWTDENGDRQSETYGERKDAKLALNRHLVEVEETKRGLRRVGVPNKSLDDLCKHWMATRAKGKRSADKDEMHIRVHLKPHFDKQTLVRKITTVDVERFKADRVERLSKKTINLSLGLFKAMMREAVDIGWLIQLPRIKLYRLPLWEQDFKYLRNRDELDRFLRIALETEGKAIFALYATAVYAGLRAGELAGLHWTNILLDRRLIVVHNSYTGITKSGDVRHVPILDPLLPVLREWRVLIGGRGLVFPNQAGNMMDKDARPFREVLHRVLRAAELPKGYITFHSLRHTFASHWMMNGGDLFKLQKILGHKSVQMTLRYAHLSPDAYQADYNLFGDAAPGEGKVVPLKKSKSR